MFLPEVVRDPGGERGGQGRALDSHTACVCVSVCACVNSCVHQGVHGSHCQPVSGGKCVSLVSFWLEDHMSECMSVCVCLSGCSAWGPTDMSVGVITCVDMSGSQACPKLCVTWCGSLCPRRVFLSHLLPSHPSSVLVTTGLLLENESDSVITLLKTLHWLPWPKVWNPSPRAMADKTPCLPRHLHL